jgi:environmental stress-induced protein Ves
VTTRSFFYFFERDRLPAMPWKNGGGSTREIACWPRGAGIHDFDWRVSIASIEQAGPFSVFEGVDRQIMLLDGDGVRLRSPDGRIDHRLDVPNRPFAFSGDESIDCTLLGGPSSDFNVMTRRGRCSAELQVIEAAANVAPCRHGLLFALRGGWTLAPAESIVQGQGVWWGDTPQGWNVSPATGDALLLAVRILES